MGWNGLKWVKMGWNGLRWVKMACVGLRGLSISLSEFQSSRSEFAGENLVILFHFFRVEPAGFVGVGAHWIAPVSTNDGVGRVKASVFIWRRLAFPKKKIKSNKKAKHILPSKRKPSNNSVTRTQPIVAGHGKGAKKNERLRLPSTTIGRRRPANERPRSVSTNRFRSVASLFCFVSPFFVPLSRSLPVPSADNETREKLQSNLKN